MGDAARLNQEHTAALLWLLPRDELAPGFWFPLAVCPVYRQGAAELEITGSRRLESRDQDRRVAPSELGAGELVFKGHVQSDLSS